ncbi:hypothetical protein KR074_005681, partial [Drosophila pseudoananassae]
MLRTILILVLLAWSPGNLADAKPFIIKVFAPNTSHGSNSATSYQSSATAAPINTQFISSLISTKIQLWNNLLQSKSSGGSFGFGYSKSISFSTTTTEKPTEVTHHTTEVNTDFTPDDSSPTTTHSLYTTTTESSTKTPSPTIHPKPPVPTTSTPVKSSTSSQPEATTTTETTSGYSYQTPTSKVE